VFFVVEDEWAEDMDGSGVDEGGDGRTSHNQLTIQKKMSKAVFTTFDI